MLIFVANFLKIFAAGNFGNYTSAHILVDRLLCRIKVYFRSHKNRPTYNLKMYIRKIR